MAAGNSSMITFPSALGVQKFTEEFRDIGAFSPIQIDFSVCRNWRVTLNASTNININGRFTNVPGARGVINYAQLFILQDAVGSRIPTFSANVIFNDQATPVFTTTAGRMDVMNFFTLDGGNTWRAALSFVNV